ncbi:MAG: hypothetical protein Q8P59_05755 [Dehalococcoidia bacterium]|nr:hypothetical protein [Dehalococcoidia bacterium]
MIKTKIILGVVLAIAVMFVLGALQYQAYDLNKRVKTLEVENTALQEYLQATSTSLKASYRANQVLEQKNAVLTSRLTDVPQARELLAGAELNYLLGQIADGRLSHVLAVGNDNPILLGDDAHQLRWVENYDLMARVAKAVKVILQEGR